MLANTESRTKNASRAIAWGTVNKLLSILLPFATRTIIIHYLGIQYVGLQSLFSSILQVLSLAELGFGSAIVFNMYKPIANGDDAKVNAYLRYYKKIYYVIGLVVLAAGLIIMPFLKYFISGDVPSDINLYVLFAIYLANNVISYFFMVYKASILSAAQRGDINSNIASIALILKSVLQIVLLILFKNYYFYVLLLPISTIINNLIIGIVVSKKFPQFKPQGELSIEEKKNLRSQVSGAVCQKIGGVVLASVDSIVISSYFGLTVLGQYNNYYYIISALMGFLGVIQGALVPSVGNSIQTADVEKNYRDFKKIHFMYLFIVAWWSCCLLCLYQPFMELWVGTDDMLSFNIVILFVLYFYCYKFGDICGVYKESMGLWNKWRFVPLLAVGVNLVLNLIISKFIGLYGILISSIVSLFFIYFLFGSVVLFRFYFKSKERWFKYLLIQVIYMAITAIACALTYLICYFIPLTGILCLVVRALICCIVPIVLLVIMHLWNPAAKDALHFVKEKFLSKLKRNK